MSLVNVAELMSDSEFVTTVRRRRPRPATFANEGEVVAAFDDVDILAAVQPATPAEVQMLPEGNRIGNVIGVWSASELRAGDGKRTVADLITWCGQPFKVIKVEPWGGNGYFRAFAEGYVP